MKNTFLYGAIVALVVIVLGLGYSKYAVEQTTPADTIVATEEVTEAVGTDEEAAENPDPAAVAADAAVAATGEAQQATAESTDEATTDSAEVVSTETTDAATGVTTTDSAAVVTEGDTAAVTETTTETTTEAAPIADVPASEEAAAATSDEESLLAAPAALQMNVTEMMADRVLGDAAAPVTIIEFASYTCSHCAAFHNNVLPKVKEQLISTGKAKLILREFPLDKFALKASLLARCAPADKYYDFAEVIFRNQDRWVKSEDPVKALKQLGSLTGMDDAQMETCLNNTEMENALLKRVTDAQAQYKVSATPTFVFNEGAEQFSGTQTPERFQEVVDQLTR